MPRFSGIAASTVEPDRLAALPLPTELPAGLVSGPRVLVLVDADAVSHGLAEGTGLGRASDQKVRLCLDVVRATARALDPQARVRYAASSRTAACHFGVLATSGNNTWSVRRGLDGADQVLLEELGDLREARLLATQSGCKHPARLAELVLLVGQDHVYAPAVRRLRLLQIPVWLLVPGRFVAASLYSSACAVSFIGPAARSEAPKGGRLPRRGSLPRSSQGERS
ncbi:MAG: hypothetical protein ABSB01_22135 [Streptosporangiaceae bacterium]